MKKDEVIRIQEKLDFAVIEDRVELLEEFFAKEVINDEVLILAEDTMIGAIVDGNLKIVDFLLEKGVSANAMDKKRELFALNYAAEWCRPEIAERLISAGANVNAQEKKNGKVPLFTAVFKDEECPSMIEILLRNGADETIENFHGNSPASLAEDVGLDLSEFKS